MPSITVFVSKEVFNQVKKLIENNIVSSEAEVVQIALLILAKVLKKCEEKEIELDKCFEECVNFIIE